MDPKKLLHMYVATYDRYMLHLLSNFFLYPTKKKQTTNLMDQVLWETSCPKKTKKNARQSRNASISQTYLTCRNMFSPVVITWSERKKQNKKIWLNEELSRLWSGIICFQINAHKSAMKVLQDTVQSLELRRPINWRMSGRYFVCLAEISQWTIL